MKTLLYLPFFIAINANAVPQDKLLHASISYGVAVTSSIAMSNTSHPMLYSFAAGMVPGLAKYEYDRRQGVFNAREKNQDIAANALGALSGALIGHGLFVYVTTKQAGIILNSKF